MTDWIKLEWARQPWAWLDKWQCKANKSQLKLLYVISYHLHIKHLSYRNRMIIISTSHMSHTAALLLMDHFVPPPIKGEGRDYKAYEWIRNPHQKKKPHQKRMNKKCLIWSRMGDQCGVRSGRWRDRSNLMPMASHQILSQERMQRLLKHQSNFFSFINPVWSQRSHITFYK